MFRRRALSRLLGNSRAKVDWSTERLSGAEDHDAYPLFESTTVLVKRLNDDLHKDPELVPGAFQIRIPTSPESRDQTGSFLKRRYAQRGLALTAANPNLFTVLASNGGELVGTVSLRLDSESGLAADQVYKREIDALRRRGERICEFTRLAIDVNARSKTVLASLFHTAYLFAHRLHGYDSSVIEVNPRHVFFYELCIGFQVIGPERLSPRVDAPAVLLHVPFKAVADSLEKYAGRPELARATHSLFPFGFSARDEEGVLGRLRAFRAAHPTSPH